LPCRGAAIISVVFDAPPPAAYKSRLDGVPDLKHITVEVHRCQ
jgi:hypothetical protein